MATVPQLKVFYVDVIEDEKRTDGKEGVGRAVAALVDRVDDAKEAMDPLNKQIKPHPISTYEELRRYRNLSGNSWVETDKTKEIRQLYIQHPKTVYSNCLIEAEAFYDYIDDEYYNELYNFIMSHCKPKLIKIDKKFKTALSANIDVRVPSKKGKGGLDYSHIAGNYMSLEFKTSPVIKPFERYVWLEKSLMTAICALTPGAKLSKRVEVNNSFGLNASLARRIGLKASACRDFELKIFIQC